MQDVILNHAERTAASQALGRFRTPPDGVSICIPNWNHEALLPRSVGSALAAAADLRGRGIAAEVLVIDDDSRDGSLTLLRQLEALYYGDGLRVLPLPENTGLPAASRNQALLNATYRYIMFLDADNELLPENLYHFYRSAVQTQAAVTYGNLLRYGLNPGDVMLVNNESFQDRLFTGQYDDPEVDVLHTYNYIDTFAVIDRMQVLDLGGFLDKRVIIAREDWELYLHLAVNGRKIIFVPLIIGLYYELPVSMTDSNRERAQHMEQRAYLKRVFNQLGLRKGALMNTRHLRYHPDIGYI
jgi:glycosyltransferase involved in cell wall biosynthesis